jgi:hypothetical protein
MTTSKSLPTRPSQESLRKQAKRLFRDISAGNAAAISRVRAQLPNRSTWQALMLRRPRSRTD